MKPIPSAASVAVAISLFTFPTVVRAQQAARTDQSNSGQAAVRQAPAASKDFSVIVERLSPSVVGVTTRTQVESVREKGGVGDGLLGGYFDRFFSQRDGMSGQQHRRERGAVGSGFLIDDQGHVITNNHVVDSADEIRVVMSDRSTHVAQLLGRDPATDIAVLKLKKMPVGIAPLQWGDSDAVKPGMWTIAIGSPFGLGGTVTVGVLSARSRDIRSGPYDDFLQTDASINRGNSGGPLFDANGHVIGVNTAIVSPSGGNIGIGFAIPSNLARGVVSELIEKGHVERGFIGATLQPVTPDISASLGLEKPMGALVAGVTRGGPAQRAGLRPGNVVVTFNGSAIAGVRELSREVAATDAGKSVRVQVIRDGKSIDLDLVAEHRPGDRTATGSLGGQKSAAGRRLGVTLQPLDDMTRRDFSLEGDETGVVVREVEPSSPASRSGIRPGDVIVSAGTDAVDDPGDVAQYWDKRLGGNNGPALFRIRRGSSYLFVVVKPS